MSARGGDHARDASAPGRIVFVTGATGFVGSHLVERLVERGDTVRCLVRATSERRWLAAVADRIELVEGALGEPNGLGPAVERALEGVGAVFHVGGLVRRRKQTREALFRVNEGGTAALGDACARHAPRGARFVFASTLAAVGPSLDGRPIAEDVRPRPRSDYGASKLAGEAACAARAGALAYSIVRLPGIYGPRDENAIELFRLVGRGFYPASRRRVCMMHVDDAVSALLLAAEHPGAVGQVLHAAARSPTVSELGQAFAAALGRRAWPLPIAAPVVTTLALASEALAWATGRAGVLDRQKAREAIGDWPVATGRLRALGWAPRRDLEEGVRELCAWYRAEGRLPR